MDTDPDDMVGFDAITEDEDEGEEGPECGTAEALSDLTVRFIDEGTMTSLHRHCCCLRHVPHPAHILPKHATLVEIILEDANGKTIVSRNGVEAGITEDGAEVPIHIPSIVPVIPKSRSARA